MSIAVRANNIYELSGNSGSKISRVSCTSYKYVQNDETIVNESLQPYNKTNNVWQTVKDGMNNYDMLSYVDGNNTRWTVVKIPYEYQADYRIYKTSFGDCSFAFTDCKLSDSQGTIGTETSKEHTDPLFIDVNSELTEHDSRIGQLGWGKRFIRYETHNNIVGTNYSLASKVSGYLYVLVYLFGKANAYDTYGTKRYLTHISINYNAVVGSMESVSNEVGSYDEFSNTYTINSTNYILKYVESFMGRRDSGTMVGSKRDAHDTITFQYYDDDYGGWRNYTSGTALSSGMFVRAKATYKPQNSYHVVMKIRTLFTHKYLDLAPSLFHFNSYTSKAICIPVLAALPILFDDIALSYCVSVNSFDNSIPSKILSDYSKGTTEINMTVAVTDYYDSTNASTRTLIVSTKTANKPMCINIGDVVVPYIIRNGSEVPYEYKTDGESPREYKVTAIEFENATRMKITAYALNSI